MEIGLVRVEDTAAGAPATIPEGHLEYHKDTDKLYKSDGATKTELASGGSYSDENAQDAVGTILTDTATIGLTYTDATPSITADVKDDSITYAKIQNVATDRLLGRDTSGSGDVEELTVSNGIEFSGSTGIVSSSRILNIDNTGGSVLNSVTETTMSSYSIAGGTLGASDILHLKSFGYVVNSSGATRGWIVKVKLGGTTIIEFNSNAFIGNSTTVPYNTETDVYIISRGATNSQRVVLQYRMQSTAGPFGTVTTGVGRPGTTATPTLFLHADSTIDMTSSQTLETSITLSSNTATYSWNVYQNIYSLLSV